MIVHNLDGMITAWSHGAQLLYGYTEQEALQMNMSQIVPKGKRQEYFEMIDRLKKDEFLASFETKRLTRDGQILDVWLTVSKFKNEDGAIIAIATSERDLSEIKRMEQTYQNTIDKMRR
ncbi:PAS domain-containing protein [candidate division KSB1 bacterium]|nr:PAS domain-containing protein [candidate division KSB1 bacterium]